MVLIGPAEALIGPEKAPIRPEKARFSRKDFCPIFSENLELKPPFGFPKMGFLSILVVYRENPLHQLDGAHYIHQIGGI